MRLSDLMKNRAKAKPKAKPQAKRKKAPVRPPTMIVSPSQLWSPIAAVAESDDDWMEVYSARNSDNTELVTSTIFAAVCPFRNVSEFRVSLETRTDAAQVFSSLQVFNFQRNGWDVLDQFEQSLNDELRSYEEVALANAYLRRPDGAIVMRLLTRASKKKVPAGYFLFLVQKLEQED